MAKKYKKTGRNAGTVSIAVIVAAFLIVMTVQIVDLKGKVDLKNGEKNEKQQEYDEELERSEMIDEQSKYFKSEQAIKDIAKEKLGLVEDSEIVFMESED